MEFEHIIKEVTTTQVKVLTSVENTFDYDFIVARLSDELTLQALNERDSTVVLEPRHILYIENGENGKSFAMTRNTGYCQLKGNLVAIETMLSESPSMCRINRNTLVNLNEVLESHSSGNMKIMLTLSDNSRHVVSRLFQKKFKQKLMKEVTTNGKTL